MSFNKKGNSKHSKCSPTKSVSWTTTACFSNPDCFNNTKYFHFLSFSPSVVIFLSIYICVYVYPSIISFPLSLSAENFNWISKWNKFIKSMVKLNFMSMHFLSFSIIRQILMHFFDLFKSVFHISNSFHYFNI